MATHSLQRYPLATIVLHWIVGIGILANLAIGWLMDDRRALVSLHKSIGIGILLLVIVRLINKRRQRQAVPTSLNEAGSLSYIGEKAVHGLLYLCMLVLPVSGWLKSNAGGHPASFFGLFDLPTLLEKDKAVSHLVGGVHSLLATSIAILVGLHLLGAIYHAVVKREKVWSRMLP